MVLIYLGINLKWKLKKYIEYVSFDRFYMFNFMYFNTIYNIVLFGPKKSFDTFAF